MRPPVHYFGGKVRMAPYIVEHLHPHTAYVEPFFGSGAVLLAKPPSTFEVANDLDHLVVNFYRVLREQPDELRRALELTPWARAEHEHADPTEEGITDLERARRWWVRCVQGFGRMPEKAGWSASVKQGAAQTKTSLSLIERIPEVAARMRHVMWESRPALEVIDRYDSPTTLFYLDPPYPEETRTGLSKRPKDYRVDMQTTDAHRELAAGLATVQGIVVLSGYPCALYDDLFEGWHRVEKRMVKHSAKIRQRGGGPAVWATEVLWSNRPFENRLDFTLAGGGCVMRALDE